MGNVSAIELKNECLKRRFECSVSCPYYNICGQLLDMDILAPSWESLEVLEEAIEKIND